MSLPTGQHACFVVDTDDERAERVVDWTLEGVRAGDRVVLLQRENTDDAFLQRLRRRGLDEATARNGGRLVISTPEKAHVAGWIPARAGSELSAFVAQSLAEGFRAVRISIEAAEALGALGGLDALLAHEADLEAFCRTHPLLGRCWYHRSALAGELGVCVSAHPRAVADGQVSARTGDDRVYVTGEVDVSNAELVASLLSQAVPPSGDLTVDLAGVTFLDIAATDRIVRLARGLGPDRTVRVVDPPPQLATILGTLGWEQDIQLIVGRK